MTNEELRLRRKFYLAPESTSLEELKELDTTYTAYPGLTLAQAQQLAEKLRSRQAVEPTHSPS
jgi:hypothetical protein